MNITVEAECDIVMSNGPEVEMTSETGVSHGVQASLLVFTGHLSDSTSSLIVASVPLYVY
jgi:threonine/homoserine/homoserine lactone efflux protein